MGIDQSKRSRMVSDAEHIYRILHRMQALLRGQPVIRLTMVHGPRRQGKAMVVHGQSNGGNGKPRAFGCMVTLNDPDDGRTLDLANVVDIEVLPSSGRQDPPIKSI